MREKKQEKQEAIRLRKNGKTILEIAENLNVSKASVSLWVRDVVLPKKAHQRLGARKRLGRIAANNAKRNRTLEKLAQAEHEALDLVSSQMSVSSEAALLLCAVMYWCEGSKSKNDAEFNFTNADPLLVRGFLSLLRKALPLDERKFRIKMHLHKYHDEAIQKKFWSDITAIPELQFQNTYWKPNSGTNLKSAYPGCIHIKYHDVAISRKIAAVARNFLTHTSMLK